jgi:hypothetical protein
VILEPSYGQLDYWAPVLLYLARQYRRPIYQHLALWDHSLGSIQKTRYMTPNGERLLFELGGYAYAWYDPSVPAAVESDTPLSFLFPESNEGYARASFEPGGIVAGCRRGIVVVHAAGLPVFIDHFSGAGEPEPVRQLSLSDDGTRAILHCLGSGRLPFIEQTLELRRSGRLPNQSKRLLSVILVVPWTAPARRQLTLLADRCGAAPAQRHVGLHRPQRLS